MVIDESLAFIRAASSKDSDRSAVLIHSNSLLGPGSKGTAHHDHGMNVSTWHVGSTDNDRDFAPKQGSFTLKARQSPPWGGLWAAFPTFWESPKPTSQRFGMEISSHWGQARLISPASSSPMYQRSRTCLHMKRKTGSISGFQPSLLLSSPPFWWDKHWFASSQLQSLWSGAMEKIQSSRNLTIWRLTLMVEVRKAAVASRRSKTLWRQTLMAHLRKAAAATRSHGPEHLSQCPLLEICWLVAMPSQWAKIPSNYPKSMASIGNITSCCSLVAGFGQSPRQHGQLGPCSWGVIDIDIVWASLLCKHGAHHQWSLWHAQGRNVCVPLPRFVNQCSADHGLGEPFVFDRAACVPDWLWWWRSCGTGGKPFVWPANDHKTEGWKVPTSSAEDRDVGICGIHHIQANDSNKKEVAFAWKLPPSSFCCDLPSLRRRLHACHHHEPGPSLCANRRGMDFLRRDSCDCRSIDRIKAAQVPTGETAAAATTPVQGGTWRISAYSSFHVVWFGLFWIKLGKANFKLCGWHWPAEESNANHAPKVSTRESWGLPNFLFV